MVLIVNILVILSLSIHANSLTLSEAIRNRPQSGVKLAYVVDSSGWTLGPALIGFMNNRKKNCGTCSQFDCVFPDSSKGKIKTNMFVFSGCPMHFLVADQKRRTSIIENKPHCKSYFQYESSVYENEGYMYPSHLNIDSTTVRSADAATRWMDPELEKKYLAVFPEEKNNLHPTDTLDHRIKASENPLGIINFLTPDAEAKVFMFLGGHTGANKPTIEYQVNLFLSGLKDGEKCVYVSPPPVYQPDTLTEYSHNLKIKNAIEDGLAKREKTSPKNKRSTYSDLPELDSLNRAIHTVDIKKLKAHLSKAKTRADLKPEEIKKNRSFINHVRYTNAQHIVDLLNASGKCSAIVPSTTEWETYSRNKDRYKFSYSSDDLSLDFFHLSSSGATDYLQLPSVKKFLCENLVQMKNSTNPKPVRNDPEKSVK